MMKEGLFYPVNNEFDKKMSALKNSFRSRMNGEAAQQMTRRGITYRLNYGIAIPHIKELAQVYDFTPAECERLWFMEIRETMLLAAMLMPENELTPDRMKRWRAAITNSDIAEQSAFYLFSRMAEVDGFVADLILSDNQFHVSTAFFAAGRCLQLGKPLTDGLVAQLMGVVGQPEKIADNYVLRGISLFLRQVLRRGMISPDVVNNLIEQFNGMASESHKQLAEELKSELLYLGH